MGDPPARFSHALCGRACFLPGAHLAMGLLNLHVTAEVDGEGRDGSIVLPLGLHQPGQDTIWRQGGCGRTWA